MITSRVLHRLLGLLVFGAVLLLVAAPAARPGDHGVSPPGVPRLTWGPPPCGAGGHGCVDLYLQNTGFHQEPELLPSVDYRIHLPVDAPLAGGLTVSGSHDVQIIGGQIDLTTPCNDASSACRGILIRRDAPGQVYIEGVYIRNPDPSHAGHTSDGIAVDDQPGANAYGHHGAERADRRHRRLRSRGRSHRARRRVPAVGGGRRRHQVRSGDGDDGLPGAAGRSRRRMVTRPHDRPVAGLPERRHRRRGQSAHRRCQSLRGMVHIRGLQLHRRADPAPRRLRRRAGRDAGANSVWPDVDRPLGCESMWDPSSGRRSFPLLPRIDGVITAGRPPEGDFVPAGSVGIGYTSPGYADAATASGVVSRPVGSSSRRRSVSRRGMRRLRSHRRVLPR